MPTTLFDVFSEPALHVGMHNIRKSATQHNLDLSCRDTQANRKLNVAPGWHAIFPEEFFDSSSTDWLEAIVRTRVEISPLLLLSLLLSRLILSDMTSSVASSKWIV